MDIHKPKPIHSWRDFLKEVGTIVLGVGIALGAEQTVEWLHWKNRVADARAAMVLELRDDNGPQAFTRVAVADCFERQLVSLRDAIEADRPRAEIMTLIDDYRIQGRTWDMGAWTALLGSDLAAHIPPEQLIRWGLPYIHVPRLSEVNAREGQDFLALHLFRRSGERLLPAEADAMLASVTRLRFDNRSMRNAAKILLGSMKFNGIEVTPQQKNRILAGLKEHFQGCVITPSIDHGDPSDNTAFLKRPLPPR